jgi:hypothetical protein
MKVRCGTYKKHIELKRGDMPWWIYKGELILTENKFKVKKKHEGTN